MTGKDTWPHINWGYTGFFWVPPAPASVAKNRIRNKALRESLAVAVTHEEVFGKRISKEELIDLVRLISYPSWLLLLSKIIAVLSSRGKYELEPQVQLAQKIFDADVLSRIDRFGSGSPRKLVFNEWQIANLARIALMVSKAKATSTTELSDRLDTVGRCLLGMNDYIGYQSLSDAAPISKGEPDEWLLESLVRSYCFQFGENPKHVLARFFDLYFKLPTTNEAKVIEQHDDSETLFRSIAGISLKVFFALGFGVYAKYVRAGLPDTSLDNQEFLLDRRTFFSQTAVSKEEGQALLNEFSINASGFRREHRKSYPRSLGQLYDCTTFRQRPLVAVSRFKLAPINIDWLYEKIGEGSYWLISDRLTPQTRQRSFRTFFGNLYQLWMQKLFARLYPTSGPQQRVYFDQEYDGKRSSDAIVYYPGKLVLFEAKWPTLRMKATMIPGSLDAFDEDIEKIIVHAAEQLHRNIEDFCNHSLTLGGVTPETITSFYPIIVTARPFPVGPLLTPYVLGKVAEKGFLASPLVKRLEIISAEELELLEPLVANGRTFPEILDRKWSGRYRDYNMKWHIYKVELPERLPENPYIDEAFNELATTVEHLLFKPEA